MGVIYVPDHSPGIWVRPWDPRTTQQSWLLEILRTTDQPNAWLKSDLKERNWDSSHVSFNSWVGWLPIGQYTTASPGQREWFRKVLEVPLGHQDAFGTQPGLEAPCMGDTGGLFQPQELELNWKNLKKSLKNMIPTEMQVSGQSSTCPCIKTVLNKIFNTENYLTKCNKVNQSIRYFCTENHKYRLILICNIH